MSRAIPLLPLCAYIRGYTTNFAFTYRFQLGQFLSFSFCSALFNDTVTSGKIIQR